MRVAEFSAILDLLRSHEDSLLGTKREAYAGVEDCLANFKQTSAVAGIPPVKVCLTLLTKHLLGIVRDCDRGGPVDFGNAEREGTLQRIVDARNYLALLAALLLEEAQQKGDRHAHTD